MTPPDRQLLTATAAARYLGVTTRAVRRLADRGTLTAVATADGPRFARAEVDAYLEANRVRPGELRHLWARSRARG